MKTIDATEVRRKFADVADRVRITGERVIVARNGRPLVAIVPIEDAEQLQASRTMRGRSERFNRAELERLIDRATRLPILDARDPDEILGYDEGGLPN